jgi:putative NADPH-quinone reductase
VKTLVVLAHPNMKESKISRHWKMRLQKETSITIHDLYDVYPDHVINVENEQELLLAHDRIAFQFPFHWYSSPSLLKKWVDEVYIYGFAYGTGNKLKGKEFCLVLSAGRPEKSYQPDGSSKYTIDQFLLPMKATVLLTEMTYLTPFVLYGAASIQEETLAESAEQLAAYLTANQDHTSLQEEN